MKKVLIAVVVSLTALSALPYRPARDHADGVVVRIAGLEESSGGSGLRVRVLRPADGSVRFSCEVANRTSSSVDGKLSVVMSSDWIVSGLKAADVSLAPGEIRSFPFEATAVSPVVDGLYAVRAVFSSAGRRDVEPVAVFRAGGVAPSPAFAENDKGALPPGSAMPFAPSQSVMAKAVEAAREALNTGTNAGKSRFLLVSGRGGRYGAAWCGGRQGAMDGVIAFTDGRHDLVLNGFTAEVDGIGIGVGTNAVPCSVGVKVVDGTLEVRHRVKTVSGEDLALRLSLFARGGVLKAKWDMPDVRRSVGGHPRYTALAAGVTEENPQRVYFSFGNVYERPLAAFSVKGNGFECATRHVGADYPHGLSLVEATDVVQNRVEFDPDRKFFGPVAGGDATFTFAPSSIGAFDAAFAYAETCGLRRSAGFDRLAGRTCFDVSHGEYANEANELMRMRDSGVRHGVFVKHSWQRWGYDCRYPDILPARLSPGDFRRARAAASQADMLFLPHDNYFDYFPDARGFSFDDVLFDVRGNPVTACWNGRWDCLAYAWLPGKERNRMRENLMGMKSAFAPDGVFFDVWGMKYPVEVWNRRGEYSSSAETLASWNGSFDMARDCLGEVDAVLVTEAGAEWYAGHCDGGIADHLAPERLVRRDAYADATRVPWHDAVTHGKMVLFGGGCETRYAESEWHKGGDLFAHGYGSDDYIANAAFSGRSACVEGRFTRRTLAAHFLAHDLSVALARSEFRGFEFCGSIHRQHAVFADGETWINRSGSDWEVAGKVLPPCGFYAKAKGVEAGILKINGTRCAFSFGPETKFVDARPPRSPDTTRTVAVRAKGARQEGSSLRLELEWTVKKPLLGYVPFVQVVPADAAKDGTSILHHHPLNISADKFAERGRFTSSDLVTFPAALADGRYALRVGMYFGADDGRWLLDGEDDLERRVAAGTFSVSRDSAGAVAEIKWSPDSGLPRDPWGNECPVKVDFGGIVTDGAFLIRNGAGRSDVVPLPGGEENASIHVMDGCDL